MDNALSAVAKMIAVARDRIPLQQVCMYVCMYEDMASIIIILYVYVRIGSSRIVVRITADG